MKKTLRSTQRQYRMDTGVDSLLWVSSRHGSTLVKIDIYNRWDETVVLVLQSIVSRWPVLLLPKEKIAAPLTEPSSHLSTRANPFDTPVDSSKASDPAAMIRTVRLRNPNSLSYLRTVLMCMSERNQTSSSRRDEWDCHLPKVSKRNLTCTLSLCENDHLMGQKVLAIPYILKAWRILHHFPVNGAIRARWFDSLPRLWRFLFTDCSRRTTNENLLSLLHQFIGRLTFEKHLSRICVIFLFAHLIVLKQ